MRQAIASHLSALYAGQGDVDFAAVLALGSHLDDAELAELIEQDGRARIERGLPATLERYIAAAPDLEAYPDALDAAIDVHLRWMAGSARADDATVDALIGQYPHLEHAIRDAAALGNALWSTADVRQHMRDRVSFTLPMAFGPLMDDGRPRYLLQERIGSGAFGDVYKAVDRLLSEEGHPAMVAVKILFDRSKKDDALPRQRLMQRSRLLEEATKARRIDHPNVVRVLDRGVASDESAYIVYELIDGGDLDRWFHGRSTAAVGVREAAALLAKIARGVQAAHSAGLVHCDLKPGNIILTSEGEPKVADFGIAVRYGQSRVDAAEARSLGSSHPIGNVAFISPEQYRMDDGALTIPSDVYALGGMLFFLLTGKLPNGSSLKEIAATHDVETGRKSPPLVRPLRREVDADLEAICRRAMAVGPEERYSSAGALADDLEAWLGFEPLNWTRPSALRVLNLWRKRKPAAALAWALLVLAVVGGTIAITHFSRKAAVAEVARAKAQMDAQIAQIKEAEAAAREDHVRARVNEFRVFLGSAASSRTTSEIFSSLWSIEHIFAPTVVATRGTLDEFHRVRFDAVRKAVETAYEEGRENDLDALLWRSVLAFWMVGAGEVDDALPMLEELHGQWERLLDPSDRWLGYLSAISAAAVVKGFDVQSGERLLSDRDLERLRECELVLVAQEREMREHDPRSPIHHLIIEALRRIYLPHLLDDVEQLRWASALPDELGVVRQVPRRP